MTIFFIVYCLTVLGLSVSAVFYTRNTLKKLTLTTLLEILFFIFLPLLNTMILFAVTLVCIGKKDEVVIWKVKE